MSIQIQKIGVRARFAPLIRGERVYERGVELAPLTRGQTHLPMEAG